MVRDATIVRATVCNHAQLPTRHNWGSRARRSRLALPGRQTNETLVLCTVDPFNMPVNNKRSTLTVVAVLFVLGQCNTRRQGMALFGYHYCFYVVVGICHLSECLFLLAVRSRT